MNVRDEGGNFELFRRILPHEVPNLTFCGYNSSLFSTVNAEVGAVWTAAHLAGALALPPVEDRRKQVARELDYMNARTHGKHARGTSVIPFSIRNIDEMLADLGVPSPGGSDWRNAGAGSVQAITAIQSRACFGSSARERMTSAHLFSSRNAASRGTEQDLVAVCRFRRGSDEW